LNKGTITLGTIPDYPLVVAGHFRKLALGYREVEEAVEKLYILP
jgi:hypothetical protein